MGVGVCFGPIGRGLVEPRKLSKLRAPISCLGEEPVRGDKRRGPWAAGSVDAGIVFVLSWGATPPPVTGRNRDAVGTCDSADIWVPPVGTFRWFPGAADAGLWR